MEMSVYRMTTYKVHANFHVPWDYIHRNFHVSCEDVQEKYIEKSMYCVQVRYIEIPMYL